jgi:hypothetical protein
MPKGFWIRSGPSVKASETRWEMAQENLSRWANVPIDYIDMMENLGNVGVKKKERRQNCLAAISKNRALSNHFFRMCLYLYIPVYKNGTPVYHSLSHYTTFSYTPTYAIFLLNKTKLF